MQADKHMQASACTICLNIHYLFQTCKMFKIMVCIRTKHNMQRSQRPPSLHWPTPFHACQRSQRPTSLHWPTPFHACQRSQRPPSLPWPTLFHARQRVKDPHHYIDPPFSMPDKRSQRPPSLHWPTFFHACRQTNTCRPLPAQSVWTFITYSKHVKCSK